MSKVNVSEGPATSCRLTKTSPTHQVNDSCFVPRMLGHMVLVKLVAFPLSSGRLTRPRLFFKLFLGPVSAFHYRLVGPGATASVEDVIINLPNGGPSFLGDSCVALRCGTEFVVALMRLKSAGTFVPVKRTADHHNCTVCRCIRVYSYV